MHKSLIFKFSCLLFFLLLCSCDKIEEVNTIIHDVKTIKEDLKKAEQTKQQAEKQLKDIEQAKQQAEELLKKKLKEIEDEQKRAKQVEEKSAQFTQIIKWIAWLTGVGAFVFILLNPLRNLIQRVLFKNFSYKSRRFDKDKK